MVDFFARSSSSKNVKFIRFYLLLMLEIPETQARSDIDSKGSYSLIQNDFAGTKILHHRRDNRSSSHPEKVGESIRSCTASQMMS